MSLFGIYEEIKSIFLDAVDLLALARIDLMVDGRMTAPIPTFVLEGDYSNIIKRKNLDEVEVGGIRLDKFDYTNGVLYWGEKKEAYCFAEKAKPFILDIEPCVHIAVSEFYRIPKNGLYIDLQINNYQGVLVSWDYCLSPLGEQRDFLILSFIGTVDGSGLVVSLELPKQYEIYDFSQFKKQKYGDLLLKFMGILLFVLHEKDMASNVYVDGNLFKRVGDVLASKIVKHETESRGRKGHWRRGHFHLYWKVIQGVKTAVYKWIEPVWVSSSKGKEN